MDNNETEDVCKELANRLKESENTYKVFGFSHMIITGCVADIIDTSFRTIIDGMYRRTKSHCKTDQETELYRERLCKLYLSYVQKGLASIDCLELKLSKILAVKVENPVDSINDRLAKLRKKVAERTKRVQSLLALQSRLETDNIMAEWIISKVEPIIFEAEKDLADMESPNDVTSIFNSLNHMKNSFQSLELN